MMDVLLLLVGLPVLVWGAELLVRGASGLSRAAGLSPLVIGLTVVAYGTSAPEVAASVVASLRGQVGIALGNVLGSNLFNTLVILGISAVIVPLSISRDVIRREAPILVAVSLGAWALAADGAIGMLDGIAMLAGIVVYTVVQMWTGRGAEEKEEMHEKGPVSLSWGAFQVLGGLLLLAGGAHALVEGAAGLARMAGVGDALIGLTIVAAGTSLPEAATSVVAALRGERDLAVGNVVGSNIFNLTGVLGPASLLAGEGGLPVDAISLRSDFPVVVAAAVVLLPLFWTGTRVSRLEGALLLTGYVVYTLGLASRAGLVDLGPSAESLLVWLLGGWLVALAVGIALDARRR